MERFTRIKLFPGYRWPSKEMPVQMLRAAQIRDTKTGSNYLQIKWKNESGLVIDYMKTRIECMIAPAEGDGELTLEELLFEYTEQAFAAGESFGDKQPIRLPWDHVDSIVAKPVEIAFHSGETWHVGSGWRSLTSAPRQTPRVTQAAPAPRPTQKKEQSAAQEKAPETKQAAAPPEARREERAPAEKQAPTERKVPPANVVAQRRTLVSPYETEPEGPSEESYHRVRLKKRRPVLTRVLCIVMILLVALLIAEYVLFGRDFMAYWSAKRQMSAGNLESAVTTFRDLGDYRDSRALLDDAEQQLNQRRYDAAMIQLRAGNSLAAAQQFEILGDYLDSEEKLQEANSAVWEQQYEEAIALFDAGKYEAALEALEALDGYGDSEERIKQCELAIQEAKYQRAKQLFNEGTYAEAMSLFAELGNYADSAQWVEACGKLSGQPAAQRTVSSAAAVPTSSQTSSTAPTGMIGMVTCTSTDTSNLRAQPSTDSEIVGRAEKGDTFMCVSIRANVSGDWYEVVRQDGTTAFIAAKRVSFSAASKPSVQATQAPANTPTPAPAEETAEQPIGTEVIGSITITNEMGGAARNADRSDALILFALANGDSMDCYGISEAGWYEVKMENGTIAYISPKLASFNAK